MMRGVFPCADMEKSAQTLFIINTMKKGEDTFMKESSIKLGFIGTGNMAGAIMGGIIKMKSSGRIRSSVLIYLRPDATE